MAGSVILKFYRESAINCVGQRNEVHYYVSSDSSVSCGRKMTRLRRSSTYDQPRENITPFLETVVLRIAANSRPCATPRRIRGRVNYPLSKFV